MRRRVRVFKGEAGVLACDDTYLWDIMPALSNREQKRVQKLAAQNESADSMVFCGDLTVQSDKDRFYRHIILQEIKSKSEAQRELGRVIVELEGNTLESADDEMLLNEARKRKLIQNRP
ncbi:MAG: hypothetical protein GF416_06265 [Candidatus Altiarchaeales archaeon]|nr:hypothetical protein [Candidatus Altiarchaeales archaeon]MBD3416720.1 hypothetical protein [Candidatus Altiarchaeales archaeon]